MLWHCWQEGNLPCKNSHTSSPHRFSHGVPSLTWSNPGKNRPVKQKLKVLNNAVKYHFLHWGTVYCNRSCLCVCVFATGRWAGGGVRTLLQPARMQCLRLSEHFFIHSVTVRCVGFSGKLLA